MEHRSLKERGLSHDSFWHVEFLDGSHRNEKDASWAGASERTTVDYFGTQKTVHLLKHHIKSITVTHGDLQETIEIPEGVQVYQAIRSESMLMKEGDQSRIVGRIIGLVKDGVVIEERFINALEGRITGIRK